MALSLVKTSPKYRGAAFSYTHLEADLPPLIIMVMMYIRNTRTVPFSSTTSAYRLAYYLWWESIMGENNHLVSILFRCYMESVACNYRTTAMYSQLSGFMITLANITICSNN